jgi:hypothetical protein
MISYQKISNFSLYLSNCDLIANYNVIQIYKKLLLKLSEEEVDLNLYLHPDMGEMEMRYILNKLQLDFNILL